MDKLQELLAELAKIDEQIDALLANDELTEEQKAEHDKLVADRKAKVAKIDAEKDRIKREEERRQLEKDIEERKAAEERGQGRRSDVDTPPPDDVPGQRGSRTQLPVNVRRRGSLQHFRGQVDGVDADVRAYRFGMWGLAQLSMQMPGRYRFGAAIDFFDQNAGQWAVHQSNNATGVHNFIPEEFGTDLILLRERFGVVRRLFGREPMSSDTKTQPRQEQGLTAFFVAEGEAITESDTQNDNIRLTAKDLAVLTRMSRQFDADNAIGFGDRLLGEISYAFSSKEDDCGFNGDGTSGFGGILGARTRLQDFDGAGTDSFGLVISAGNLYSELVLGDFDTVVGRLPQFADGPDTAWVMHRTFYYEVCEALVQASGGVPAMEVREGNRRPRPLFKGYPVEFSQKMPKTEANAQVCALLGDFNVGAAFGDREDEEIAFSEHATIGGQNVFERGQIAIRGIERFDINVHSVGNASDAGAIVGLQTAAS